jgi:GxxExxY protein
MIADATPMAAEQTREELDAITGKIIGAAQRVSSKLGWGFLEKVYENSLKLELIGAGLRVEQQVPLQVLYEGQVVGDYLPDLLVADQVVVELKAIPVLSPEHRQQCLNYLRATGFRVCLLLNFGRPRLEVRRFVWHF